VAVPSLGEEIVLLEVSPQVLLTAALMGAGGALLVEISSRVFRAAPAPSRSTPAPAR
jgi:cation-transporting ATPase E